MKRSKQKASRSMARVTCRACKAEVMQAHHGAGSTAWTPAISYPCLLVYQGKEICQYSSPFCVSMLH